MITFSYARILKNKRLIQSSFFSLHSFIFVSFQPGEKRIVVPRFSPYKTEGKKSRRGQIRNNYLRSALFVYAW